MMTNKDLLSIDSQPLFVQTLQKPIPSAYVHVPFCGSICAYCAFERTLYQDKLAKAWLERIIQEIQRELHQAKLQDPAFQLQTIYIGGGTPTKLSVEELDQLLSCFQGFLAPQGEWTIEANPESLTLEKLLLLKRHGINRLSIGIQSFNDRRLASLGRHHTAKEAKEAFWQARKAGFENISVDLMYGFFDQSLEELDRDLDAFLALQAEHLSIYSLILEPNTLLSKNQIPEIDESLGALLYEHIERRLESAGYEHYEVSSYAKENHYGLHNTLIWLDGLYYGFGYGAIGRNEEGLHRFEGSLGQYAKGQGIRLYEEDANPWFDALMTGLRTRFGVDIEAWQRRYGLDFFQRYKVVLEKYRNLLFVENGRLFVNGHGMEILDTILIDFLMEDC